MGTPGALQMPGPAAWPKGGGRTGWREAQGSREGARKEAGIRRKLIFCGLVHTSDTLIYESLYLFMNQCAEPGLATTLSS